MDKTWFANARYGMVMQYGLYSLLGRGEWVMNREEIPVDEYAKLADHFTAEKFNADELIERVRDDWGIWNSSKYRTGAKKRVRIALRSSFTRMA